MMHGKMDIIGTPYYKLMLQKPHGISSGGTRKFSTIFSVLKSTYNKYQ